MHPSTSPTGGTFAQEGDEANTMLATAMMVGIIKEREKDILQLCVECRAEIDRKEDQNDE